MECLVGASCPNISFSEMVSHLKEEHDIDPNELIELILMRIEELEEQLDDLNDKINRNNKLSYP